ncbi:MAG: MATE family efflux transporter [Armatimonadota bacterium]
MNYVNHPDTTEERCHYCKLSVCAECSKEDRGLLVCPKCYESLNAPERALDESSPDVAAGWAIKLSVAGLVFFGLGLFTVSLFYLFSLGLSVITLLVAFMAKRHFHTASSRAFNTVMLVMGLVGIISLVMLSNSPMPC